MYLLKDAPISNGTQKFTPLVAFMMCFKDRCHQVPRMVTSGIPWIDYSVATATKTEPDHSCPRSWSWVVFGVLAPARRPNRFRVPCTPSASVACAHAHKMHVNMRAYARARACVHAWQAHVRTRVSMRVHASVPSDGAVSQLLGSGTGLRALSQLLGSGTGLILGSRDGSQLALSRCLGPTLRLEPF